MRGFSLACTAALLLLIVARPAFADDPYAEFRIPDSQGFRWLVNGGFGRTFAQFLFELCLVGSV